MSVLLSAFGRGAQEVAAGGGGFDWNSIPNQLIRVDPADPSTTHAAGVLTGLSDISGQGRTVTVASSPAYTAANALMNGQPTWRGGLVTSPAFAVSQMQYVVSVSYREATSGYPWATGSTGSSDRYLLIFLATEQTNIGGNVSPFVLANTTGLVVPGLRIATVPLDGVLAAEIVGSTPLGVPQLNAKPDSTLSIGTSTSGTFPTPMGFFMALSAVPDAPTRASIIAELVARFTNP